MSCYSIYSATRWRLCVRRLPLQNIIIPLPCAGGQRSGPRCTGAPGNTQHKQYERQHRRRLINKRWGRHSEWRLALTHTTAVYSSSMFHADRTLGRLRRRYESTIRMQTVLTVIPAERKPAVLTFDKTMLIDRKMVRFDLDSLSYEGHVDRNKTQEAKSASDQLITLVTSNTKAVFTPAYQLNWDDVISVWECLFSTNGLVFLD